MNIEDDIGRNNIIRKNIIRMDTLRSKHPGSVNFSVVSASPTQNNLQIRRVNMYKSYSMELAGRTLTVDVGRVAAQANGAAFMHYGDTVVLSTATASDKPREGIDFFPLSVE